jgi:hypothetical protein
MPLLFNSGTREAFLGRAGPCDLEAGRARPVSIPSIDGRIRGWQSAYFAARHGRSGPMGQAHYDPAGEG